MTLPKEIGDRDYQAYIETPDGKVARSTFGGAYVTDVDGNVVEVITKDRIKELSVIDHQVRILLEDVRDLLRKMNQKLDQFFM
jgi:hypothetical protein